MKKKIIFITYMITVFIFTIIRCLLPGEQREERVRFGVNGTEKVELYGNQMLRMEFRCLKEGVSGISFEYSDNDIDFEEETIRAKIYRGNVNLQLIQDEIVELAQQVDETEIYLPIQKQILPGEQITAILIGTGTEEGPVFQVSEGAENYSTFFLNGEMKADKYLAASAFYDYRARNFDKIIIDCIVLLLSGGVIYLIHDKTGIVFRKISLKFKREKRRSMLRKFDVKQILKIIREKKKKAVAFVLLVIGIIVLLDYTYYYAVEKAANECVDVTITRVKESDSVYYLKEGVKLAETFRAEENNLSGVGLAMKDLDDKDGIIKVTVQEGICGKELFQAQYPISELAEGKERREGNKKGDNGNSNLKNNVWLEFPQVLETSENKEYTIIIELADMEGQSIGIYYRENTSAKGLNVTIDGETTAFIMGASGLYKHNLFLKPMYLILCVLLFLFLSTMCYLIFIKRAEFCNCFLAIMLMLGIIYTLVITVYAVPDEPWHIDTAYRVSNQLMGIENAKGPNRAYKRSSDFEPTAMDNVNISVDSYRKLYEELISTSQDEQLKPGYVANTLANATRFNYLPQALGFTIARMLHLGYLPMILLGRIWNLAAAVFLMYFGLKKLPFGKTIFAIIGMLPITLQQVMSCSYDPVLIGCAYIFVGYCLFLAYTEEEVYLNDIIIMMLSGGMLAACKGGVYLPLVFLILLIPFKRKLFNKKWLPVIGMLCLCVLFMFGRQFASKIFTIVTMTAGSVFGRAEQVELYTVSYFIQNPIELLRVFENTFMLLSDHYIATFVGGLMGWLNVRVYWFVVFGFCLLLFMASMRGKTAKQYVSFGDKCYFSLICLGCLGLIAVSMLVSWTPMGNEAILGIQGRYFIPFMGVGLCALRNQKLVYQKKNPRMLLFGACILQMLVISQILMSVL